MFLFYLLVIIQLVNVHLYVSVEKAKVGHFAHTMYYMHTIFAVFRKLKFLFGPGPDEPDRPDRTGPDRPGPD